VDAGCDNDDDDDDISLALQAHAQSSRQGGPTSDLKTQKRMKIDKKRDQRAG
jgi:hypothetical protein